VGAHRLEALIVPDTLHATRRRLDAFGRRVPTAPVAIAVLLYSTGPVLAQATSVSGPVFSFWRLWFGVGVLGAAMVVHGAVTGRWPALAAWRWSLGAGVAFGLHQLLMFSAIKATTVADVTLVGTLSPVVTALIALPFFRERPGVPFRLWSLVAMAGTAVVVAGATTSPEGDPVGMALALANVFAFAGFFLLSKGSRGRLGVLPFLTGVMFVAAVVVTGYVAVTPEAIGTATSRDLLLCLVVALVPGALGHAVMTWPLGWVPANVPPVLRLGVPIFASLWAWWWLGEAITVWHLTGGLVTIAGVAGAVLSPSGRRFVAGEADRPTASG
jgi:drug/metabolite transporter (DMT)-like permease